MWRSQKRRIMENVSGAASASTSARSMRSAFIMALADRKNNKNIENGEMDMKRFRFAAAWLAAMLVFSLIACSHAENLMTEEPSSEKEAAELYQKLMQKEGEIQSEAAELWEKLFATVDKDNLSITDNNNYGDFLLKIIEDARDQFSEKELKTLNDGAGQIKKIEEKLASLEEKYPDCVNMQGAGDSVDAAQAGMESSGNGQNPFPGFQGRDLDGAEVNSSELFAGNTVTVVNFWFTTCKPCVSELPELEALHQELAQKGGAVIGINAFTLDGEEGAISDAKDLLSKKGVSYQNIWFASDSEAGKFTSGLYAFPTTYVVDNNGNIVGEPIVGAVTAPDQIKALQALIDQAISS